MHASATAQPLPRENPRGLWVYCILQQPRVPELDEAGIDGRRPITLVEHDGLACAVSDAAYRKYRLERDNLIAHQRVNEAFARGRALLPVRFATIAAGREEIVRDVLRPRRDEFRTMLGELGGQAEYGVRARWTRPDAVLARLAAADPTLAALRGRGAALGRNEMIAAGERTRQLVERHKQEVAGRLVERLRPRATRVRENRVLGDANVLNAAFLIPDAQADAFTREVERLGELVDAELEFRLVGPSPPFNFVEIVIAWSREESRVPAR